MAWWNRIADAIRGISERLQGTGGEQPQQYEIRPTPVQPVLIQPSASGVWPAQGDYDYEPVYEQSTLYGGEPNDTVTLYDENLLPLDYTHDTGEPINMSPEEWYEETFRSKEYLIERYGLDNIDILQALYSGGYIDDDDWETWREIYGSMYG